MSEALLLWGLLVLPQVTAFNPQTRSLIVILSTDFSGSRQGSPLEKRVDHAFQHGHSSPPLACCMHLLYILFWVSKKGQTFWCRKHKSIKLESTWLGGRVYKNYILLGPQIHINHHQPYNTC